MSKRLNDFGAPGALNVGTGDNNSLIFVTRGVERFEITSAGVFQAVSGGSGTFGPLSATILTVDELIFNIANPDVHLTRDGSNILALKNSTTAQRLNIYNSSNGAVFEQLAIGVNSVDIGANTFSVLSVQGGGGTARTVSIGTTGLAAFNIVTNGSFRWRVDGTPGHFRTDNPVLSFGWTAGAGGVVTQLTSKSTTVVLNTATGNITMDAAALAADTTVSFTLTNSVIEATDYVAIQQVSGGTQAAYITTATPGAGSAVINVHNATPGALSEAIVLKFIVVKAVIA